MIYVLFSSTYHGELDYLALKKLRVIIYNDNQAIWEQDAAGSSPVTPTKGRSLLSYGKSDRLFLRCSYGIGERKDPERPGRVRR